MHILRKYAPFGFAHFMHKIPWSRSFQFRQQDPSFLTNHAEIEKGEWKLMEQIDEIMCGQGILNINSLHEVDLSKNTIWSTISSTKSCLYYISVIY